MNKLFHDRRFRYGSAAVALTCVCVALVIVFNAIFTVLAGKNGWFVDMTEERIFDLSEESIRLLDGLREKDGFHIDFIFCQDADRLDENYYMRIIHNLTKQYAEEFNFIDVKYVDINTHPGDVEQYKKTSSATIATTSLIVASSSAFRVYTRESLYTLKEDSSDVYAFNGEYKLTSAILSLAGDNPIAYFTTGHGETTEGSEMYALCEEAGFEVRVIDLAKETIDPAAMLLIVNNPQFDFMGRDATVNEIKKLDSFMDNLGNLMVFIDAKTETARFRELNEYLKEWGIQINDDLLHDYENSLSVDGTELVSTYASEGAGASLTTNLRAIADPPKTVVNYARSLTRLWNDNMNQKGNRNVSSVLSTSPAGTAVSTPFGENADKGQTGVYDLMLVSRELRYINNVDCYNNVLVAGTSSFTDDKYIGAGTYGNRDLIFSAMQSFGKKNVPIDLNFKVFDPEGLDITTAQANRWTVILAVVFPVVVFAVGGVVYFRRKSL